MVWTPAMDNALLLGVGVGRTRRQIAQDLGVTRNAVIGRHGRLREIEYPYRSKEKAETARRRAAVEANAIACMVQEFWRGASRSAACYVAWREGATVRTIARYAGVSSTRVGQLLIKEKRRRRHL